MLNQTITIHVVPYPLPQEPEPMIKPRRAKVKTLTPRTGRPRKAADLRVARGVRLDPVLVDRAESFIGRADMPHIQNFTNLVEVALKDWLERNESGVVQKVKLRSSPQKKRA